MLPAPGGCAVLVPAWASVTRRNTGHGGSLVTSQYPVGARRRLVTRSAGTSASVHNHPLITCAGWWPRVSAEISEAVAAFLVRLLRYNLTLCHCLQTTDSLQSPQQTSDGGL